MTSSTSRAQIIEAIIDGASFREAGEMAGLTATQATQNFYRGCRELRLSKNIDELRAAPAAARKVIADVVSTPANALSDVFKAKLLSVTGAKNVRDLTPERLSKVKANNFLANFSPVALVEIQKWLQQYGLALQPATATAPSELRAIEQAIAVLKAYGFNVDALATAFTSTKTQSTKR